MRPTDQETITIEKMVCPCSQEGPGGEAPGWVRRRREQEEDVRRILYCGFHRKGGQGKRATLNKFHRLCDAAAPSCLVPGPGVTGDRGLWVSE